MGFESCLRKGCKRAEFVVQYLYESFAIFCGEKIGRNGEMISPLDF
jgi:hypothetical protein